MKIQKGTKRFELLKNINTFQRFICIEEAMIYQ